MVGIAFHADIETSQSTGSIAGADITGGAVGSLDTSSMTDTRGSASVSGVNVTGGLVGEGESSSITDSLWQS